MQKEISELMASSGVAFGTSGARGLAVEMTDLVRLRKVDVELYGGDGRLLEAVNTKHLSMAEGDLSAFAKLWASHPDTNEFGAIVICQAVASRIDVHLGDRVRVTSQAGDRWQEWRGATGQGHAHRKR